MEEGKPSATALGAARLRAAHQLLDVPAVFVDPLALRVLGPEMEREVRLDPERAGWPSSLRALVAVRSRYAEDELAQAVGCGLGQYVVLGAGLDTFAYRNAAAPGRLRVFEVDHPSTQQWKRARLAQAGVTVPGSLTFVPVDFQRQTLSDALSLAGFNAKQPAFFSLLGVAVYLPMERLMSTLAYVAALPQGSAIVFDYGLPSSALSAKARAGRDALAEIAASMGEPWITHFDPLELEVDLRNLGFREVEQLGPDQARDRYLAQRPDGLKLSSAARVVKASS